MDASSVYWLQIKGETIMRKHTVFVTFRLEVEIDHNTHDGVEDAINEVDYNFTMPEGVKMETAELCDIEEVSN